MKGARELTTKKPTVIDLFCGAGGLSAGLTSAGFEVVGALDSWEVAVETYRRNFRHPVVRANIRSTDPDSFFAQVGRAHSHVDLIAGGPPCQGFSVQRIGDDEDDRNDLLFEFARFVCEIRPRMFLMENVPGLLGKRGQSFARRFESIVSEQGYAVEHARVNTAEYGIPQVRKRVFYYGWLRAEMAPFRFPKPNVIANDFRSVWQTIGDLPVPAEQNNSGISDPLHYQMRLSSLNRERLRLIPPGGGFEDLPVAMRVTCHKNGPERIGHRNVYGRLDPDKPACTITGRFDSFTRGQFAHPYEDRNITLREGARLQTFRDDFMFNGSQEDIAALIGNAIPPQMGKIVGAAIRSHLRTDSNLNVGSEQYAQFVAAPKSA